MAAAATKVALVTAGSNGLGAAIARCLALEGDMSVVINFHSDSSRADALVQQLTQMRKRVNGSAAPQFAAIKADMGQRNEIRRLVTETVQQMGHLDVVISNAGWTRVTDFSDLQQADDEADWDRCFNMNVKSHFFLFQACREHLEKSEGAFIATASVAGVTPSGSSLDWGRQFSEEKLNSVQERNALKRFATIEDVAQQVKYLALAKSVTGQIAVIDAGFSL
ncbi:short chain dehydrogenase [Pyrenophora tritici-repentis Pt-1C-BFP]|uniref:Short chain dehydrogenase n=1 Tax=Pyrenophora tritici-repentis (strain Pt-1C-BFP) TaxID=426418 RepID=B2WPW9_PYRTR|nr:short chain dehydrogenase [Pyrenophora tritici-repentis Pt-1C-BFP]EDU46185.1 short chain dehydrogenase [Pyrenophora tritici-repentis Pt-1C-BFP]